MMPPDIGAIDLMIGFPSQDPRRHYEYLRAMAKDAESQEMEFPAEYMFKDVPNQLADEVNPVDVTLAAMDEHGVAIGHGRTGQRGLDSRRWSATPIAS